MDWSSHYPAFVDPDPSKTNLAGARKLTKDVEVVDIGCGFGGLLIGLAPLLPETLMVGKYDLKSSDLETYSYHPRHGNPRLST
jgi:tRNA (guanine-N7-)-methyltransferase